MDAQHHDSDGIDRTCAMRYCLNCNADAVYPLRWWEDGPKHWQVELICGNCEVVHQNRYHQIEVDDFDTWLDDCTYEIQRAWRKAERQHMKDYVENFVTALDNDVILPEDF